MRRISHQQAEDAAIAWLAKLNTSDLTQETEAAFFEWLNRSSLNQAAYIKAEQIWKDGIVYARVTDKPRASFAYSAWALAACLTLIIGVSLAKLTTADRGIIYQTALGEQKEIVIADGSRLTLNTDSRVEVLLNEKSRIIKLEQGEVFFDVQPDPQRPFDVISRQGVTRVLGTHFAVQQLAADTLVTVQQGKVALGKQSMFSNFTPGTILHNNERQSFQREAQGKQPEKINAERLLAWKHHQLIYQQTQLTEVIRDLNRYLTRPVKLQATDLATREITAVFQLSDPDRSLAALANSLGLVTDYDAPSNQTLLKRK